MPLHAPLFALLTLLACGDEQAARVDPAAMWEAEPAAALKALKAIDDPAEREIHVRAILRQDPAAAGALCGLLTGAGRDWCEKIQGRPHLWTVTKGEGSPYRTKRRMSLPQSIAARWEGMGRDPGRCDVGDAQCLEQSAAALALAGQIDAAGARCLAAPEGLWRNECFFKAAEAVRAGPTEAEDRLALCAMSGSFLEMCLGHAMLQMQSDELALVAQNAEALRDALGTGESLVLALYWCLAAHRLLERQPAQLSAALAAWPPAADPHLRSALAMAVIAEPDPARAFAVALAGGTPPALQVPADRATHTTWWMRDLPGEEKIDAIPFLFTGADRRPTVSDPALDARLALLSALAYVPSPNTDKIAESIQDPDPIMRWTATRLLSHLAPGHPALLTAASDPDPRVRARSQTAVSPKRPQRGAGPPR